MHATETTATAPEAGTEMPDADVGPVLAEMMTPAERMVPNPNTTLPTDDLPLRHRHRHRHRHRILTAPEDA